MENEKMENKNLQVEGAETTPATTSPRPVGGIPSTLRQTVRRGGDDDLSTPFLGTTEDDIYRELKNMTPDEVESFLIGIMEDIWDEVETTSDPTILDAFQKVDLFLSGESETVRSQIRSEVEWDELLKAAATLQVYRISRQRRGTV